VKRIVIVDDDTPFLEHWKAFLEERYAGQVSVETCADPLQALKIIRDDIRLLMLDLEMPNLDGKKLLQCAVQRGVDRRRIVIASARDADYLHGLFPPGECLAVINKQEPAQQAAFLMILDSVMRKP
jgi:DNA-binding response OmpR family regulator